MKKYLFLLSGLFFLPFNAIAGEPCGGVLLENITECGGHQMGEKISPLYPRLADKDHNPSFYVTDQQQCLWPAPKILLLNCYIVPSKQPPFYSMSPYEISHPELKKRAMKIYTLLTQEKDSDLSMPDASKLTGKYLENTHSACGQKVESYLNDHRKAQKWTKEKWQAEPCPVTPLAEWRGENKGFFSMR